jgi:antitoxin component YwqK of YwqJK toxin-antitoxin module
MNRHFVAAGFALFVHLTYIQAQVSDQAREASVSVPVKEADKEIGKWVGKTIDGKPSGKWVLTSIDGKVMAIENYRDGKLHGRRKSYYPSGRVWEEKCFVHGKPHGVAARYYENGQIADSAIFVRGKLHGLVKSYYTNGETYSEGFLEMSTHVGRSALFLSDGTLYQTEDHKDGRGSDVKVHAEPNEKQKTEIEKRETFGKLREKDIWVLYSSK